MPTDMAIVNGVLGPLDEAQIGVTDLGLLRGLACFETLRTYGGHPHALSRHLARLDDSCRELAMANPIREAVLRDLLRQALVKSGAADLRITLLVTGGPNTNGLFDGGPPAWIVIARVLKSAPESSYTKGVGVATFRGTRFLPGAKTTSYITGYAGYRHAHEQGAEEALYLNEQGLVTEGVTSNVVAVHGDTATTPAEDCLGGITRETIARIAAASGLAWREASLTAERLKSADEVWITSSVREVMPVVRVDDTRIGTGAPGRWFKKLIPLYRQDCLASAAADARRHG